MINVDTKKFMEDGYLILRQVIPADMLDHLRQSAETVVKRRWPDGRTGRGFQGFIHGPEQFIDEETADIFEFLLHENTLGVSRQVMPDAVEVAPQGSFLMCNAVEEHGPWFWHRDINPITKGPLGALQYDMRANGPGYVHFNIALVDDDTFWVVPGSHLRPNTDEENRQLLSVPHSYAHGQQPMGEKRHSPLPNSVCADLKAGDAVINHLELLHWASNYGRKLRRTFHIGYRSYGGPSMWYEGGRSEAEFAKYLSPSSQRFLEKTIDLFRQECVTIAAVFTAIINKDESAFREGLVKLHPGEIGRFVCVIHLCKYAQQAHDAGVSHYTPSLGKGEIETLWQRFEAVDRVLQADEDQYVPAFQIRGPTRYWLNEMPTGFDVDDFVKTW